ncbi:MAG: TM2 domain-containing protein [Oscillospiraceae bacterium]|nr:TM2 domain-containing protein [Oscillospiraceae bacterium]
MDNNRSERRSINLSKDTSRTGSSSGMREAYPVYNSDDNAQDLQRKEYRNTASSQYSAPAYKSMPANSSYNIPPVAKQNVSQPLAGYQNPDNLNRYYDNYGTQSGYAQPQQPQVQPHVQPQVQPATQTATKFCKYCGERIPSDAVVCTHCGRQVENLNGGMYAAPVNNMINIGQQPAQQYQMGLVSDKSKSTSLILAALGFFGLAGIHRLYCGKILSGLLYLCTGGLCMVGTLVDILKLASNTFTDGTGAIIKK